MAAKRENLPFSCSVNQHSTSSAVQSSSALMPSNAAGPLGLSFFLLEVFLPELFLLDGFLRLTVLLSPSDW